MSDLKELAQLFQATEEIKVVEPEIPHIEVTSFKEPTPKPAKQTLMNARKIQNGEQCGYCGEDTERVTGKELFPNNPDTQNKQFLRCKPCRAHVGCHEDGRSYGSVAQPPLRAMRTEIFKKLDEYAQLTNCNRREAQHKVGTACNLPNGLYVAKLDEPQAQTVLQWLIDAIRFANP